MFMENIVDILSNVECLNLIFEKSGTSWIYEENRMLELTKVWQNALFMWKTQGYQLLRILEKVEWVH